MSADVIAKCQWLEKKYTDYQQENQKLHKRLKKVEKELSAREHPLLMYTSEVEHANALISEALIGYNDNYQRLIQIPMPKSYTELYNLIFPRLKDAFLGFVRCVKIYIDFLDKYNHPGPIFTTVSNDTNELLREKLSTTLTKLSQYNSLLQGTSWSVSLDGTSQHYRTEILQWTTNAMSIVKDMQACLMPKKVHHLALELEPSDFT